MMTNTDMNANFITKCIACVFANKRQTNKRKLQNTCILQTQNTTVKNKTFVSWLVCLKRMT